MFKKLLKKLVHDILVEMSKDFKSRPMIKELVYETMDKSKGKAFLIIETKPISEIGLTVTFIDPKLNIDKTIRHDFNDIPAFFNFLKTYQPEFEYVSGCNLTVEFEHAFGKNERCSEFFLNSYSNDFVRSSELHKIIKPLLTWFDERPELLV